MMSSTTIDISLDTRDMLLHFAGREESYDHIIKRLIEESGWKELDTRWNKILEDDEFIPLDEL